MLLLGFSSGVRGIIAKPASLATRLELSYAQGPPCVPQGQTLGGSDDRLARPVTATTKTPHSSTLMPTSRFLRFGGCTGCCFIGVVTCFEVLFKIEYHREYEIKRSLLPYRVVHSASYA